HLFPILIVRGGGCCDGPTSRLGCRRLHKAERSVIIRRSDEGCWVVEQSEEAAIRDWCVAYLAKSLNRSAALINPDVKFARLGVDSAASVFFLVDLEEWLNKELPGEILLQHPTINQLARHLAAIVAVDAVRAPQQS